MAAVPSRAEAAQVQPDDLDQARSALETASAGGQSVRIQGAGTKLHWGRPGGGCDLTLSTAGLNAIREHNHGDLTAVLEAGVPLDQVQEAFADAGQMLALDPWLGPERQATIGGVLATADSGPLAHRYGSPRDLVLGMTVVLADGTVARSGGQVIKNVAGYDVAKLFCGSYGTLGLIAVVNLRLHPRPETTVTACGQSDDPVVLAQAAGALAAAPFELEALDVSWEEARGRVLARCGGASAERRVRRVVELMAAHGLTQVEAVAPDEELWEGQRAAQRSEDGIVIRVAAPPGALGTLLSASRACRASLVGRAALGLSYLTVEEGAVDELVRSLPAGARWTLLDAPEPVRARLDPWGPGVPGPALELMRRVKSRFDPTSTCNPGLFVGGI